MHLHSIIAYLPAVSDSHGGRLRQFLCPRSSWVGIFGFLFPVTPCVGSVSAQAAAHFQETVIGAVTTAPVTTKNLAGHCSTLRGNSLGPRTVHFDALTYLQELGAEVTGLEARASTHVVKVVVIFEEKLLGFPSGSQRAGAPIFDGLHDNGGPETALRDRLLGQLMRRTHRSPRSVG